MAGFETVVQQAVFDALDGNVTGAGVYDDVPFLPEGQPDTSFPYVVIGDDTHGPFDTDTSLGSSSTITLHFWSRHQGRKEIKAMMGEVYDLLNRQPLIITGFNLLDILWEFSNSDVPNTDLKTRHGVQRYRLTLERN